MAENKDPRHIAVNTWTGGMNKDTDEAYLKPNQYIHAENLRLVADVDGKSGSMNNIPGNVLSIDSAQFATSKVYTVVKPDLTASPAGVVINGVVVQAFQADNWKSYKEYYKLLKALIGNALFPGFDIVYNKKWMVIYTTNPSLFNFTVTGINTTVTEVAPSYDNLKIIGSTYLRDDIIVFTCPEPNPYNSGQIWKMKYNDTPLIPSANLELLYNNTLNFNSIHPIRDAKGNYENSDCSKIYFTDNSNYLRSFNYADPDCFAAVPETLDIIGDIELTKPLVENISSGALTCGTIQYAYKLYNKYYSETSISPLSNLISIGFGNEFGSNDASYGGDVSTRRAGKSVEIKIPNVDRRYDFIKIYSIKYNDGYNTPVITVVADLEVGGDDIYFIDSGTTILQAVTIDEFNIYGKTLFNCKTIEVKNNLLLAANINNEIFDVDFDSRAYRYDGLYLHPHAGIKESGGTTKLIEPTFTYGGQPIERTSDAINADVDTYKYKNDGIHIGGSGPNIDYEVTVMPLGIGYMGPITGGNDRPTLTEKSAVETWSTWINDDFVDNQNSFTGYASPFNSGQFRGYMRGETYRFGIVFYSKKGLRSPVKWIGDIKMPESSDTLPTNGPTSYYLYEDVYGNPVYDFRTYTRHATGPHAGECYANILGLNFNVNLPQDVADQINGFEIVRVDRTGKEKTVLAQGILGRVDGDSSAVVPYRCNTYAANTTLATGYGTLATFASPDGVFDKNIELRQGDQIIIVGQADIHAPEYDPDSDGTGGGKMHLNYCTAINQPTGTPAFLNKKLIDSKFVYPDLFKESFIAKSDGTNWSYFNSLKSAFLDSESIGGSTNVLSIDDSDDFQWQYPSSWIGSYRRNIPKQYGGNTYDERSFNQYITTGAYRRLSNGSLSYSNIRVYGGDTFIGFFDHQRLIWLLSNEDGNTPTRAEMTVVPVETSINLTMRSDRGYIKSNKHQIQEQAITFVGNVINNYTQDYDLYQYNPAYSRSPDINIFFAENNRDSSDDSYDCRIRASARKENGSLIDDWTNFLQGNYIDIDTNRGSINKILNFKNIVYCFQNNGFGVASIDDRSVVSDTSSASIVLGNGSVLPRYDYISRTMGTFHQFSVFNSDTAIYFFDQTDRQIKVFMGQEGSVSDNYGIKSFLFNNVTGSILTKDLPNIDYGVNGYFDDKFNECVFNFHKNDSALDFTVAFSESGKCFTSFYSFSSPIYIKLYSKILSVYRDPNDLVSDSIWLHNFGEYNKFYNTRYESNIHFLVNENYQYTKVFDNCSAEFESFSGTINAYRDFFDYIRCYNEYQNTDWNDLIFNTQPISGKQIHFDRRERKFNFSLPRNMVDALNPSNPDIFDPAVLTDPDRLYRERLRSRALHIELTYGSNNPNNLKINFPLITTTYRVSAR